jgi:hypothetical protein
VTRAEKDRTIAEILSHYDRGVGAVVVCDETCLGRLLSSLQLDLKDQEVGDYLCSFLVA